MPTAAFLPCRRASRLRSGISTRNRGGRDATCLLMGAQPSLHFVGCEAILLLGRALAYSVFHFIRPGRYSSFLG